MWDCFKKDCISCFAVGAVAGILGLKIVKTQKVRDLAVHGLAQGMMAKDCAMEELTNLREEAEEICNEAREMAKQKSDCGCSCDCGCGCDEDE